METLLKDLHYSLRRLLRQPGFTAVVVITLALGIGANTAIFSVVSAVLLRPLPFPEPDRLVMIWEDASLAGFPRATPAPANYADWRAQNQVFEDVAALSKRSFNLTRDGEPERITAWGVTANFLPTLGVSPFLGRAIQPEDDKPQARKVAIVSYGLWQQRYGGERSIIGKELLLDGEKYVVIGVMPPRFQFLDSQVELWVPMGLTPEQLAERGNHYLTVVARMKAGVTVEQANADVSTIQHRIAQDHPNEAAGLGAYVIPLRDQLAGNMRRPLLVLLVAVGFVLLIACANIANLLLSRAARRQREIAVRAALGAGRARIVRQLIMESLSLSMAGAACGLIFASWSFAFLRTLIPDGLTLGTRLTLDLRVLAYTLLVSFLTTVIFGVAPAFQASKIDLNDALKQSGGRGGWGPGDNRLRSAMVVSEMALALVLLIGAALLIQTLLKLRGQYAGLGPEQVLTLQTPLPKIKYPDQARRAAFYEQVLQRVKSLPGVASAGYTTSIPLDWKGGVSGFYPEGRTLERVRAEGLSYNANHRQVSADYLQTMGIPLRQGRYFTNSDDEHAPGVAIINGTMARQYWPGEDAIYKRFKLGDPEDNTPWLTIVGIAGDVRQMGIGEPIKAEMYLPFRQVRDYEFFAPRELVIRTSVDPLSIAAAVRNEIHQVDPDQPVSNIRTMAQVLGQEIALRRAGTILLTIFGGLALLLSGLGIYGVLAYFVVQHTRDIGVRLALGAQRRDILQLVLKSGMSLALLGGALGLAGAFALTRLMAALLYEVTPTDGPTFALVTLGLQLVALFACYLPARRATKVDPLVALRYE